VKAFPDMQRKEIIGLQTESFPFDGMIAELTERFRRNVHDHGQVAITASSRKLGVPENALI
jgi:hypothetical protein